MKKLDEKTLDFLEQQIPDLMAAAITVAYNDALARGESVLQVEGNALVEQFPDGTKRFIEKLEEDGQFTQWVDQSPPRWFETYVLDKLN